MTRQCRIGPQTNMVRSKGIDHPVGGGIAASENRGHGSPPGKRHRKYAMCVHEATTVTRVHEALGHDLV